MSNNIYGQANQDLFVLEMTKYKKEGFFVELGSQDPINTNNTFTLERNYNWKGIMVEIDDKYLNRYKLERPNSHHIINDARKINYLEEFEKLNVPENMDYLQIDLEPINGSTLQVLEYFDKYIFDKYKFATITFEHDLCYCRNIPSNNSIFHTTRIKSREIFEKRGYIRVFSDISNNYENGFDWIYEDWYIHPDLVDMNNVNEIIEKNKDNYITYNRPDNIYLNVDKMIYYHDIKY